jgi:hypothetical protein
MIVIAGRKCFPERFLPCRLRAIRPALSRTLEKKRLHLNRRRWKVDGDALSTSIYRSSFSNLIRRYPVVSRQRTLALSRARSVSRTPASAITKSWLAIRGPDIARPAHSAPIPRSSADCHARESGDTAADHTTARHARRGNASHTAIHQCAGDRCGVSRTTSPPRGGTTVRIIGQRPMCRVLLDHIARELITVATAGS